MNAIVDARPKRIRRGRKRGDRLPDNAVCVDRSTPLGNPFEVGVYGRPRECVTAYAKLLDGLIVAGGYPGPEVQKAARDRIMARIARGDLRGKDLACYCRLCPKHEEAGGLPLGVECPDCPPCHGDPLLAYLNR